MSSLHLHAHDNFPKFSNVKTNKSRNEDDIMCEYVNNLNCTLYLFLFFSLSLFSPFELSCRSNSRILSVSRRERQRGDAHVVVATKNDVATNFDAILRSIATEIRRSRSRSSKRRRRRRKRRRKRREESFAPRVCYRSHER